ncbi:class II aminotransferase/8-amino-7-oxononanoate synthase [Aspergillus welwitschiae]|uniref:Class II aminotransferase/8-amino-7-oxononanoate synthase n=1 Tax=Aspergillus welwitschiae TaxID=1341132 RepID=A0A3F3Q537_9EURO|nr:class II aminotransferase/8-amino-7-oxononanoate synthase [Aspergillus welwitschiae]RDH34205.1 class II aminotransferase/8-amino-7-oxononanoate synthase [Aspergillus welwitschiae]
MNPGLDTLCHKLEQTLALRREQGRLIEPPSPAKLDSLIDFSSNDSLSLTTSGILTEAFLKQLKMHSAFTIGSTSSRILDGTKQYLLDLERDLAKFHRAETAMFFNSGYDANVALWSTIPQPGDFILYDAYVHASIHDGMRRGRATTLSFKHNDCQAFKLCLEKIRTENSGIAEGRQVVFVALESFYSMDGDSAPVVELLEVAHKALPRKNFIFSIDEAHSNGIMGPNGSGFVCHYGLEENFPIRLQTCGKALGSTGAALLIIFSTAPSFLSVAAVRAGYDIIGSKEGEDRRKRLQSNVCRFYTQLTSHPGWPQIKRKGTIYLPTEHTWYLEPIQSPIVPVVPRHDLAVNLGKYLEQAKYRVSTVHYPIVPDRSGRVRIVLHADHTPQQIDHVVELIMQWANKQGARGAHL